MIHVTSCSALKFETTTGSAVATMVWSRAISATLNNSAKTTRRRGLPDSRRLSSMLATNKVSGVGGECQWCFDSFFRVYVLSKASDMLTRGICARTSRAVRSRRAQQVSGTPKSYPRGLYLAASDTLDSRRLDALGSELEEIQLARSVIPRITLLRTLPRMSARPHAECSSVSHSPYIAAPSLFP